MQIAAPARWRLGLLLSAAQVIACFACSAASPLRADDDNSAGTNGFGGDGSGVLPTGNTLPCGVSTALSATCQDCHGEMLIGGAPMHLLTWDDFQQDYSAKTTEGHIGETFKLYELAKMRLESTSKPMPPLGRISATDKATLDAWFSAGAPAGASCTSSNGGGGGIGGSNGGIGGGGIGGSSGGIGGGGIGGSSGGIGGSNGGIGGSNGGVGGIGGSGGSGGGFQNECDFGDAYTALTPLPGETCYELAMHNGQTPGDTTPYSIAAGEHYEQFYFKAPWPTGAQATRFGTRFGNVSVLHHWLLFTSAKAASVDGTHETVIGTQIGDQASLIAGWAVGGCNITAPPDVALVLPANGTILNVQWHYYNSTGAPVSDNTAVQVCTVPAGTRPNVAGITWLGTENFNGPFGMPPGPNEFSGTCPNDSGGPITIWAFWPHMHTIGRNMRSVVHRLSGVDEEVFNQPFDFNLQVHYMMNPTVVLQPGETITSTCTFDNNTGANVAFGPSTTQEMCYQFAMSYPAGALDNGVISLIGATNTCW